MPSKPPGRSSSQSRTAFQHIQNQLKLVDMVVEICDARVPSSSRHPRSIEIFGQKPRLLILQKEDIADPQKIKQWLAHFQHDHSGKEAQALSLSLKTQRNRDQILNMALTLTAEKRKQHANKGLLPRPMRVCVVGMPNVGKSSLINWLIGQKRAKTGNRPGVTRGAQWVRVHPQIELLDTPGILPAFAFSKDTALKLALCNLYPEASYDVEEAAMRGLELMKEQYPQLLQAYIPDTAVEKINLEEVARRRNLLSSGGKLDLLRAANIFVSDLRTGKLGRVTLDQPPATL